MRTWSYNALNALRAHQVFVDLRWQKVAAKLASLPSRFAGDKPNLGYIISIQHYISRVCDGCRSLGKEGESFAVAEKTSTGARPDEITSLPVRVDWKCLVKLGLRGAGGVLKVVSRKTHRARFRVTRLLVMRARAGVRGGGCCMISMFWRQHYIVRQTATAFDSPRAMGAHRPSKHSFLEQHCFTHSHA